MEISLGALRRLGLAPNSLAVGLFLMDHADDHGRITARSADLAEEMDMGLRTVQIAVRELIDSGFMSRVRRGSYQIDLSALAPRQETAQQTAHEVHAGAQEVQLAASKRYVRTTTSTSDNDETANAVSSERGRAPGTPKGITMIAYDDGEGLGGLGRVDGHSSAKDARRNAKVPDLHREVPRDQWTMSFVVKEFKHRLWQWQRSSGKSLVGDHTKSLAPALNRLAKTSTLTVQEAAALCDMFFDDQRETARLGKGVLAYVQFLQYVKVNVDQIRGTVVTDEYRESVMSQELPWA